MADLQRRHDAAALGALQGVFGALVGLLLFGDYLTLSVSKLLTGSVGNWTVFAGALQGCIVLVAVLACARRRRLPALVFVGYAGLCLLTLGHCLPIWLNGDALTEYSMQKVVALFFLCGPALLLGVLVGQRDALAGAGTMWWFLAVLLLLCGMAVATNPRLLTIEYFANPPTFLGVLVMPTHQALAFCLAKAALTCLAHDQGPASHARQRAVRLALLGVLTGLVLLTGARSYAVALMVALAAQAMFGGRRIAVVMVGAAVSLGVFQYFASDLVQERFDPERILESLAYRERESVWESAWQCFGEHPMAGVGLGEFARASGWHGRVYPHNLPLEIASELGIAGLLCLAVLMAAPLLGLWGVWRRRERLSVSGCYGLGLLVFGFAGALAVGDLIRNYFLFFGIGLTAAATAPRAMAAPARRSVVALGAPVRLREGTA